MRSHGLLFLAAMALAACLGDDRVAGGTDEVENPALTAVAVDGQGRPVSGLVKVYARFQNPRKDTVPVLSLAFSGSGSGSRQAVITDSMLLLAMDAAKARGIPWTNRDTVAFNLVGTHRDLEAYRGNFLLVRPAGGGNQFRRVEPGEGAGPDSKGRLSTAVTMLPPVLAYKGRIGTKGLELGLKAVFIPGSPYSAEVAVDGSFEFARLAQGRYELKAMDQDAKVYSSFDSLNTGTDFTPTDWTEADIIWAGD